MSVAVLITDETRKQLGKSVRTWRKLYTKHGPGNAWRCAFTLTESALFDAGRHVTVSVYADELAYVASCSRRTVARYIARLIKDGWLRRHGPRRYSKPRVYELVLPDWITEADRVRARKLLTDMPRGDDSS